MCPQGCLPSGHKIHLLSPDKKNLSRLINLLSIPPIILNEEGEAAGYASRM